MPEREALTNENTPWSAWMFCVAGRVLSRTGWYLLDGDDAEVLMGKHAPRQEASFKRAYGEGLAVDAAAETFIKWFVRYRQAAARRIALKE